MAIITKNVFVYIKTFPKTATYDIMSAEEKQAAAKQTFVFPAPLANECPAKQDKKRDSANS